LYAKYIPPFVNCRMHSLTTLLSTSKWRSSVVAGAGAVDAKMFSNTPAGSSAFSSIIFSRVSCSCKREVGSGNRGDSVFTYMEFGRFESLLQNESRSARVLNTGDFAIERSEEEEESEREDCAEDGRPRCTAVIASLSSLEGIGDRILRSVLGANWTCGTVGKRIDDATSWLSNFEVELGASNARDLERDGRAMPALRDARVFSATLARSWTRGIAVTPLTP
jgi:hypothetical protein